MKILLFLVFFITVLTGCESENLNSSSGFYDFGNLESQLSRTRTIVCDDDRCCVFRCWTDDPNSSQNKLCVTRQADDLSFENPTWPTGANHMVFPEWMYANDCFVLVSPGLIWESNVKMQGREFSDGSISFFIQCFAGRTNTDYAGEFSTQSTKMTYQLVDGTLIFSGTNPYPDGWPFDNRCRACQPRCSGRDCGNDSCGGSCGTCQSGQSCTAAGQCTGNMEQDACSACISSCRGLSSCCTGCGCLCESACGMCW